MCAGRHQQVHATNTEQADTAFLWNALTSMANYTMMPALVLVSALQRTVPDDGSSALPPVIGRLGSRHWIGRLRTQTL